MSVRSSDAKLPDSGPLRILFTLPTLEGPAGGSLYVRDFALELLKQGHLPVVFATCLGALAETMRNLTIPVIDRLDKLTATPDLIHGNGPIETVAALLHFPETPAIFSCHGWNSSDAIPPKMPHIVYYIAVDETCRDRLVCHEGIPEEKVRVHFNPVDLRRFLPRSPLPARPQRALVFSNSATEFNYVPAIRQACAGLGITLDVVGEQANRVSAEPEKILSGYDLVFAKARCALEALAIGNAVIVCDVTGLASLVTTSNLDSLRNKNFGWRAQQNPITPESIAREITKYDAEDAARVSEWVRARASLGQATESLVAIYREAIRDFRAVLPPSWERERKATADFLQDIAPFSNTFYLPEQLRSARREALFMRQTVECLAPLMKMDRLEPEERQQIKLLHLAAPPTVFAGEVFKAILELQNTSSRLLASFPPHPVHLSYHWLNADRSELPHTEGLRTHLSPPLPPKGEYRYAVTVRAPEEPGCYFLRVTLVQEQVAWFDDAERGGFLDTDVTVN